MEKNRLQVCHAAADLCLTQTQMATLFETPPQNIVQHLADIHDDGLERRRRTRTKQPKPDNGKTGS
jgi:hypothetical protein